MVEIGGGFKMGVVKYIGETDFAPGVEWIGVAFDKPNGKEHTTGMMSTLYHVWCAVSRETQWNSERCEIFQM